MCMSTPDIPKPPDPKPPPPPPPPAPPAPNNVSAAERQSAPEKPGAGKKDKRTDRSSLRIPKKRAKGLNLPGTGGSSNGG